MLYPKITTHVTEVLAHLRHIKEESRDFEDGILPRPIPLIGTVKLHGTHADIVIHHDDTITFQSRNVANLSCEKDNQGFATAMSAKSKTLLRLRDLYVARWRLLNPSETLDPKHPVLIAGEWIGEKIQKDVAVADLSKRFVIISLTINGRWQKDQDYCGISLPNQDIYNISRAGVYHTNLYPDDIQRTIGHTQAMAEQVAAHCPFAETFGIIGKGEGIVWKPADAELCSHPELWFKTKGGKFRPTYTRAPKKSFSFDTVAEDRRVAAKVAQDWCSEQRMEQGLDVLREKNIARNMQALTQYLKWIHADILTEEKTYIQDHEVNKAELKIEIAKIAKPWYLAALR